MPTTELRATKKLDGIHVYSPVGEGPKYYWGDAEVTVKASPEISPILHMSAWQITLPSGKSSNFLAAAATERVYCCREGSGSVFFDGVENKLSKGDFFYCGRGVRLSISNTGPIDLTIMGASIPSAAETKKVVFEGQISLPQASDVELNTLGLLREDEKETLPEDLKGDFYLMHPDEGLSFWQPAPSIGYVTGKTPIEIAALHNFGMAEQVLEPGAAIVEHGHKRSFEMLTAVRGTGKISVNGEEFDFLPGTVAIVGPRVLHTFKNVGDDEFAIFGFSSPTDQGEALLDLGVHRTPGEDYPQGIERSVETAKRMTEHFGFIIPGINA